MYIYKHRLFYIRNYNVYVNITCTAGTWSKNGIWVRASHHEGLLDSWVHSPISLGYPQYRGVYINTYYISSNF